MFFHMVYKSGQIFLPFCHNPRVWRTDRQTDGRTDRILIARPRLHSMQRGKNIALLVRRRLTARLRKQNNEEQYLDQVVIVPRR